MLISKMSKKSGTTRGKVNTAIPFAQKQTNFSAYDQRRKNVSNQSAIKKRSAVIKTKILKKPIKNDILIQDEITDSTTDNETNEVKSAILSVDSDFVSSSEFGDTLINEKTDTSTRENVKQQNVFTNDTLTPPKWDKNNDETTNTFFDFSYCTPPKVEIQPNLTKKAEQYNLFSRDVAQSVVSSSLSKDYCARQSSSQSVYGRPAVTIRDQATSIGIDQKLSSDVKLPETYQISQQESCGVMDLKYADLTHMQLKRSLDQIHGQNLRSVVTNSFPEHTYGGVQTNLKVCYSDPMSCNALRMPHIASRPVINHTEPICNGFSNTICDRLGMDLQLGTSIGQPSRLDTLLQVKDAMLQEKEAVILKLRLQISSLQHQVQEGETALRQVVKSHIPSAYATSTSLSNFNRNNELQTQRKIHELEQLLGKAENKLQEKASYFKSERNEMEDKIEKLQETLKNREVNFFEFKKRHKITSERMDKYKKRVERLERYLADLPTLEESDKLKTEADMLSEEREVLSIDIAALKVKLEETNQIIYAKETGIEELKKENNEKTERISDLENKLKKLELSKKDLGHTERDSFEDMRCEVVRLIKEKEDASLVINGCEKRIKQLQEKNQEDLNELQKKLKESDERNEALRHEFMIKQQTYNKVQAAVVSLSSQNQQLLDEKLSLQERVKNLEKFHAHLKEASQNCARLQRETAAAVYDLKAVTQVIIQTMNGTDPNLSALLGVRNETVTNEEDLIYQAAGNIEDESDESAVEITLSSEQTARRLSEIRKLRDDIDYIRSKISNHYADNIGDNCLTQ